MTSAIDKTQAREEEIRIDAMADQASRNRQCWPEEGSAMNCRVCDEEIPEARRLALPGVQTCIECQEELERGAK